MQDNITSEQPLSIPAEIKPPITIILPIPRRAAYNVIANASIDLSADNTLEEIQNQANRKAGKHQFLLYMQFLGSFCRCIHKRSSSSAVSPDKSARYQVS
ncbi:unnamed protein product [Blepharisma stoltei]|uniref:Uncharacterized protein n=1 Tax=Blepharisma stoltei TaxID=1481888 RepID=A0AAU9ISI5_9CILI|nr:unnamed protein product [Blepharisma stoltei]